MVSNGNKINIDIVMRLFDMAKTSSDKNAEEIKELAHIISDMLKENSNPTRQQVMDRMDYYHKQKDKKIEELENEIGKIEDIRRSSLSIKKSVNRMKKSITAMITVVIIAFTLMAGAYFFVSNSVDKTVDMKLQKAIEEVMKKK